jgi:hypothetical protein
LAKADSSESFFWPHSDCTASIIRIEKGIPATPHLKKIVPAKQIPLDGGLMTFTKFPVKPALENSD